MNRSKLQISGTPAKGHQSVVNVETGQPEKTDRSRMFTINPIEMKGMFQDVPFGIAEMISELALRAHEK